VPAQEAAVHADRRRCTWMYETRNETAPRAVVAEPPIRFRALVRLVHGCVVILIAGASRRSPGRSPGRRGGWSMGEGSCSGAGSIQGARPMSQSLEVARRIPVS